jgi:protein-arginine kinase activator protein McsA
VKQKRMTHYCIDKECGWEEISHKVRDGIRCLKCNGPVMSVEPTDSVALATYQCLHCKLKERVEVKKEDYSEVKVCPKCNGAFVDIWRIGRYQAMEGNGLFIQRIVEKRLREVNRELDLTNNRVISLEKELDEARLDLRNIEEEKESLENFLSKQK